MTVVYICRPYYASLYSKWFYADLDMDEQIIAGVMNSVEEWHRWISAP